MARERVLIVEDEPKIAEILKEYLEQSAFTVDHLERGDRAIVEIQTHPPDLVLLDILLPGVDGIEVCREVRKFSTIPIIMITAKIDEVDRLIGLEIGADDYICKPFSPREVVARVKAVLRRTRVEEVRDRVVAGPIVLDVVTREVEVEKSSLDLTPSEFELLRILMAHPGRVFSRSELLDHVQGYQFEGYDRTIDSHIKNLRKKISKALPRKDVIQTVYGVGYKFMSESRSK
jgi:two-component system response regulator BaeR